MQYFVLVFDLLVMMYYIYQMPVWDCIKNKFPFFQYEAKTAEKADCTNFLLSVMFILISKVSFSTLSKCTVYNLTIPFEGARYHNNLGDGRVG